MGNYPTKAHFGQIHRHVRPYYIHMPNSPKVLHRAAMPSTRRGCAEILGDGYQGRIPLPRIPTYRGTNIAAPKNVKTPDRQCIAALAMHMLNGDVHVFQRTRMQTHANMDRQTQRASEAKAHGFADLVASPIAAWNCARSKSLWASQGLAGSMSPLIGWDHEMGTRLNSDTQTCATVS